MIIGKNWLKNTLLYSDKNGWQVLGNRILNPDGTRHWDRAKLGNPQILVDYKHPSYDKDLYQTSGFILVRKQVFQKVKWDENCLIWSSKEGKTSEDVQFSLDLKENGYLLDFNSSSCVWHNDDRYTEFQVDGLRHTLLKEEITKSISNYNFLDTHPAFERILEFL
jgi:GT2 family glycosyltransferase